MLKSALDGIHRDLFADAFAFRPLAPLADRSRLLAVVPRATRRYVRWLPHTALVTFTVFLMFQALAQGGTPMTSLLVGVPILLTLVRPIGAWWCSVAVIFLSSVAVMGSGLSMSIPFAVHALVMLLVAMRSRPRVAGEMWLATAGIGVFLTVIHPVIAGPSLFEYLVISGVLLFAVLAFRVLRESREQVAVQAAVTEVERSRRTVLEERTTIARELHDVVAHHMSVVAIQAEAAPYRVQDTPPELAAAFATIRENAVAALTELRRVLGVIRSDSSDVLDAPEAPQPTLDALDGLLANVRQAGLTVEHVVTGAVRPLPQGVELSAYRIVQEALSNVLRHAPGSTARVEVAYVLGGLGLRVVNGPPDRTAKPSPGAGHGVLGMRERVGMLGGEMTAEPTADGGYEVSAFLPVDVRAEAAA
ncbi:MULTISPECIES: sensor histidine kinase [Streptomyces]|uniref:sensor histidine kinase n=1 Tax=Streptomyces TaxID=1883 RepID=UPI00163BCDFD|nr:MULTISPECIES: histidine kinase [Streptomyces]MBC2877900.1 two-component sensor histidine kinase [Streptomyces sp. TYQ1024]UBI41141.1 histidine kinase [Streptomyces mobaraensis]UKW33634.1 histidine kinase [Streptomyces sp. TYQ1024]